MLAPNVDIFPPSNLRFEGVSWHGQFPQDNNSFRGNFTFNFMCVFFWRVTYLDKSWHSSHHLVGRFKNFFQASRLLQPVTSFYKWHRKEAKWRFLWEYQKVTLKKLGFPCTYHVVSQKLRAIDWGWFRWVSFWGPLAPLPPARCEVLVSGKVIHNITNSYGWTFALVKSGSSAQPFVFGGYPAPAPILSTRSSSIWLKQCVEVASRRVGEGSVIGKDPKWQWIRSPVFLVWDAPVFEKKEVDSQRSLFLGSWAKNWR